MADTALLRRIPKIDVLLGQPSLAKLIDELSYEQVRSFAKANIEKLRQGVLDGSVVQIGDVEEIAATLADQLSIRGRFHLRPVINATGIVLHTNLGRAPLGKAISAHIAEVAQGYSNLEYNLEAGHRGSRYAHVEDLICEITGAEAAAVVNNNAAAVFLVLDTLCKGEPVAISRGELVEIGGSFRVPDIMARSGAELVEIGTTNKTHPVDYERAVQAGATTLLKVHLSNFAMTGFTESVSVQELAQIAAASDPKPLVYYDAGSALLVNNEELGIHESVTVRSAIRDGADIVSFSGDKLMGSAQAGIIVGRRDLVERVKKNQLARVLRIDKLSLAALEMTLQLSRNLSDAIENVPTLGMLAMDRSQCRELAHNLLERIQKHCPSVQAELIDVIDEAGGGSLPSVEFPGAAVAVSIDGLAPDELEHHLREQAIPVIVRVKDERVLFSARTLSESDLDVITSELGQVAQEVHAS